VQLAAVARRCDQLTVLFEQPASVDRGSDGVEISAGSLRAGASPHAKRVVERLPVAAILGV